MNKTMNRMRIVLNRAPANGNPLSSSWRRFVQNPVDGFSHPCGPVPIVRARHRGWSRRRPCRPSAHPDFSAKTGRSTADNIGPSLAEFPRPIANDLVILIAVKIKQSFHRVALTYGRRSDDKSDRPW